MTLVAKYGAGAPLETIPLRAVEAADDLIYAFDAGEVSVVDTDLTGANALGYSGRFETTDYLTATLLYVGMNTAKTSVCKDQEVRQAVALAVDRETVVDRLLAGHAMAAVHLIHPLSEAYAAAGLEEGVHYAAETGEELLAGAGWVADDEGAWQKGRTRLALRFLVNQDNSYKVAIAEALATDLETLGCEVTLDKLPWDDFASALEKGEFDLYLGETAMTADFDPEALVGTDGVLNYGKYSDADLDAAIDTWRAAQGEERRLAAQTLYSALAEAATVVPVCFKNGSVLTQWGQVGGMSPTQRDVFNGFENWKIER